jgi:hypothetical protein
MSPGEILSNPFVQKVVATVLGAGLYILAHRYPDVAAELGALAGALGVGTITYHMTPPAQKDPK